MQSMHTSIGEQLTASTLNTPTILTPQKHCRGSREGKRTCTLRTQTCASSSATNKTPTRTCIITVFPLSYISHGTPREEERGAANLRETLKAYVFPCRQTRQRRDLPQLRGRLSLCVSADLLSWPIPYTSYFVYNVILLR